MTRTLLIDADVFAYQCAAAVETAIDWGDGYWTWGCDFDEVCNRIDAKVELYMDELDADELRLCLTDSEKNFRLDVLPTYKGNRKAVKKPLVLKAVREWLIEDRDAYIRPRLEGDDIMGIFATWKKIEGEKIIVSIDKDMKTIPGLYCRDLKSGIVEVSGREADYWHLFQTLTGDTTDGYSGCPDVGPLKAEHLLKSGLKLAPYEYKITRGKQKGETVVRFEETKAESMWDTVLSCFEAAGLTEADALQQARVARILRASDYSFKRKEPILWTP